MQKVDEYYTGGGNSAVMPSTGSIARNRNSISRTVRASGPICERTISWPGTAAFDPLFDGADPDPSRIALGKRSLYHLRGVYRSCPTGRAGWSRYRIPA